MDGGANIDRSLRLARPALEDFAYIAKRMRPCEREQFLAVSGMREYDPDITARALSMARGPTFALVDGKGVPVLLGGFEPKRRGVYEAWLVGTTDGWDKYWRRFTRECGRQVDAMLTMHAHRIEVYALENMVRVHAWYETIGFAREATLKGYCADGRDAVMYARVR